MIKGTPRTLMKAKSRSMWVFKDELVDEYHNQKRNAPYDSTINRIERYIFTVSEPDSELIAYRVLHTRNSR